jgi:hypothetical protein
VCIGAGQSPSLGPIFSRLTQIPGHSRTLAVLVPAAMATVPLPGRYSTLPADIVLELPEPTQLRV